MVNMLDKEVFEAGYHDRPYLKWMSGSNFVKYKYPKLLIEVDKVLSLTYWELQQTYMFSRNQTVNCYCGVEYLRKNENEHRQTDIRTMGRKRLHVNVELYTPVSIAKCT